MTALEKYNQELVCQLVERDGYLAARVLPDGTVAALGRLLYTTAIHLEVDTLSWARRFCFSDPALAAKEFERLTSCDDEPQGYIATRIAKPVDPMPCANYPRPKR